MKKGNWFWNILILLVLTGCILAFVLHYKNWTTYEEGNFEVTSGIYQRRIAIAEINEVVWVQKLPQMERKNGFSWLAKEKGVFLDSLTQNTAYVFVDDLRQRKIKITYNDSLQLYFNLVDSIKTQEFMTILSPLVEKKE